MATILEIDNPWRRLLTTMASFRDLVFHVETGSRQSGRRTVVHEYPKRDLPYAEDMGRHAKRFNFSGYLIYRPSNPRYDYVRQRDALMRALEQEGPGPLVHPVFSLREPIQVAVERYSMTESRQRGGFTQFDMQFVEAGSPGNVITQSNTSSGVKSAAAKTEQTAADNMTGISADDVG